MLVISLACSFIGDDKRIPEESTPQMPTLAIPDRREYSSEEIITFDTCLNSCSQDVSMTMISSLVHYEVLSDWSGASAGGIARRHTLLNFFDPHLY